MAAGSAAAAERQLGGGCLPRWATRIRTNCTTAIVREMPATHRKLRSWMAARRGPRPPRCRSWRRSHAQTSLGCWGLSSRSGAAAVRNSTGGVRSRHRACDRLGGGSWVHRPYGFESHALLSSGGITRAQARGSRVRSFHTPHSRSDGRGTRWARAQSTNCHHLLRNIERLL